MKVLDLGTMGYEACTAYQTEMLERVISLEEGPTLLFVEHPPVLTLGANFHSENLLEPKEVYEARGIEVHQTFRGGDVTYHGPGQLVIYPIFPLSLSRNDLHQWMRDLEETMIRLLAGLGISGERFPPHTGVWVEGAKIAAIGVKIRRRVSMHGIALNCNNPLDVFSTFVPCGIRGHGVTSLTQVLGRDFPVCEAKPLVVQAFQDVFFA